MPELPEVETIRRDLVQVLVGKKLSSVEVLHAKAIKSNLLEFKKFLPGKILKNIDRIGKLIIFEFGHDKFLLVHLKMTGQLIYQHKKNIFAGGHSLSKTQESDLPGKYTWVIWHFGDGASLYFSDMRKFGYIKLVSKSEKNKIISTYGPEPLTKNFTMANFIKAIGKRTAPIKSILLNQNLVAGIGNIYADEACFTASVFPGTRANKLKDQEKQKLFTAINEVLRKAIKHKGTTFKDFRSAHGRKGNFSNLLQVYHRQGQKCFSCSDGVIAVKKIAGRSSHYCPVCQKVVN